jgi:hypothetical protein
MGSTWRANDTIKAKSPLDKLSGLAAIFASGSSLGLGEQTSAEN